MSSPFASYVTIFMVHKNEEDEYKDDGRERTLTNFFVSTENGYKIN